MKLFNYILLFSFVFNQHFNLEIDETGESTLFIFQSEISNLNIGDEIGLFDSNGIINENGVVGEILVGSGVWEGSQLSLTAISSVDLSAFGGPILPGSISGNSLVVKTWNPINQIESEVTYNIVSGSGTFNGLFTAINEVFYCELSEGSCDCDGNQLDECGICNGPGPIYDCGCNEINDGFCDCLDNIYDCSGECAGNAIFDECGICNGDSSLCSNSQVLISFYETDGVVLTNILYENHNLIDEICFSGNPIVSDLTGTSLVTNISECITPSIANGSIPIFIKSTEDIAGFQFNLNGLEIIGVSGGAASDAGFSVSYNDLGIILGFSFTGSVIEESGNFYGCLDTAACNYNQWAEIDDDSCSFPEEGYDCEGDCFNEDCNGDCNGDAILDECGICNGPGAEFLCYETGTYVCSESDCDDSDGSDGGTTGGGSTGGGTTGGETDGGLGGGDCFETDCGYYLALGYTCQDAIDYGIDCSICDSEGLCDDSNEGDDGGGDSSSINYETDIEPILTSNCTGYCHSGGASYFGGLSMETYWDLLQGGNSGPAIIPFNSEESLIIQKLNGTAPGEQMPSGGPYFSDETIDLIASWIDQGAIGPDGDGLDDSCEDNEIEDCNGICYNVDLLEDGVCNDGSNGGANFNCVSAYFDGNCENNYENCSPDCPVGILKFGLVDVNYNDVSNLVSGQLEIVMDCQFSVSDFEITISDFVNDDTLPPIIDDFNITQFSGGTAIDSLFSINLQDGQITGSGNNDSFVPPGEQSLIVVDFETNSNNICFSYSNITTSIGISYEAILDECIPIAKYSEGWNWISFNQSFENMSLNAVFDSLNSNPSYIKSQVGYADYYDGYGWLGTLEYVNNHSMYKLDMNFSDALALRGEVVDVSSTVFPISQGWNWIGYSPSTPLDINSALSNIETGYATYMKSQSGYADFYSDFGWFGTLEQLNPLYGYILNATTSFDFIYNNNENLFSRFQIPILKNNMFNLNIHDYEHNGSITVQIESENLYHNNLDGFYLVAYNQDKCVGYIDSRIFPINDNVIFPLMVYGNEEYDITFKLYDNIEQNFYPLSESILFVPDMHLGNGNNPILLRFEETPMPFKYYIENPHPNPFNSSVSLKIDLFDNSYVKSVVYDILGKQIATIYDGYAMQPKHTIFWNANDVGSGIYFITTTINNEKPISKKIVLIK